MLYAKSLYIVITILSSSFLFAGLVTAQEAEATPETTAEASVPLDCVPDDEGACLQLPAASGIDANDDDISFPDAFELPYVLVVMPFDRDQQVQAQTWLPSFEEFADTYPETFEYYSIAALPDLNAVIRGLVMFGIRSGVRDESTRSRLAVLFLDEQEAYLDALNIEDDSVIRAFLVDTEGVVYWTGAGVFEEETAASLREAVAAIILNRDSADG